MPRLDMGEIIHEFSKETIKQVVTKTSPGNYALGRIDEEDGLFIVEYVGRADIDVADRIAQHLGEPYKHFKFSCATSPRAAFLKECQNYHDFGGKEKLNNKIHPDRPKGTDWKCPCCDIFDK